MSGKPPPILSETSATADASREHKRQRDRERAAAKRADPAFRQAAAEYQREYRRRNKKKLRRARRRYYRRNRERIRALERARYWADRNRALFERQLDRVARCGAAASLTPAEWDWTLAWYEERCAYCGAPEALQLDHAVPLDRGGAHSLGNVVPACPRCNQRKGRRELGLWLELQRQERGLNPEAWLAGLESCAEEWRIGERESERDAA